MPADNILVLVIDGLRASALGAYGNTTFSTPALDQFAAESFLFDFAFADATDLRSAYAALWQSLHPLRPASVSASAPTLAKLLAAKGYHSTLVTDDPAVGSADIAADFDDCVQLECAATARADDISQTCLAQLFAAICQTVREATPAQDQPSKLPRLVWGHSRGMYGPWDAPLELQESLLDHEEGDPAPYEHTEPPNISLTETQDPDIGYAISCAYAAQVMVLDDCIEMVRGCLAEMQPEERWLTVVVGSRGFGLGEHDCVGDSDGDLFSEWLHVPMLWRFPDEVGALARSRSLVSHLELLPTLLDWVGDGQQMPALRCDGRSLLPIVQNEADSWREAMLAASASGQLAIRTTEWCLRRKPAGMESSEAMAELYVRPDDRWEANDVASLCPDVVEHLSAVVEARSRQLLGGDDVLASKVPDKQPARDIPL
jgi:arylsulfatase A-like enzyme